MRVDLHARVLTREGEEVGRVQLAVIDPAANDITHFVVGTGGLFGRDILVPRADLERATQEGDAIRLDVTRRELEDMPDYIPVDYTSPPVGWVPPTTFGYPATGYLWPVSYQYGVPPPPEQSQATVPQAIAIDKGSVVLDLDGDVVGEVEDVRFDLDTGRLTGVVVRVGNFLQMLFGRGGTVEIDAWTIDHVDQDTVYLNRDREDIKPS